MVQVGEFEKIVNGLILLNEDIDAGLEPNQELKESLHRRLSEVSDVRELSTLVAYKMFVYGIGVVSMSMPTTNIGKSSVAYIKHGGLTCKVFVFNRTNRPSFLPDDVGLMEACRLLRANGYVVFFENNTDDFKAIGPNQEYVSMCDYGVHKDEYFFKKGRFSIEPEGVISIITTRND